MNKGVLQVLALALIFGILILIVLLFGFNGLTGFVLFNQGNQSDFAGGTYENTMYNGSAIALRGINLTGNYTSHVFDAGLTANWNNITFIF